MKVVKDDNNQPITIDGIPVMEELVPNKKQIQTEKEIKKENWDKRKVRLKLLFTSLMFCLVLYTFKCPVWVSLLPLFIHMALSFYSFAVVHYRKRMEKRYWIAYMKKYGGQMGCAPNEIHPHIMVTHKMMMKQGKKIPV